MEPATGTLSVVSIHKNAPHPNAAKLLFDFIISDEGQKVFRDADYLTADPAVPPREVALTPEGGHFRTHFFSPEALEDNMPKWTQVFEQLFR
jgi:iron(III) transport system substrate-binding protein